MTEISSTLIINEKEVIDSDIIPVKREDLRRSIRIKSGAHVYGSVVGGSVVIEPGVTIEGSVLAHDVNFSTERHTGEEKHKEERKENIFKVNGDVIGLSSIISSIDSLLIVNGNLIASDVINVSNAMIYGNIISSSVMLGNIICRGVLGLVVFEEKRKQVQSWLSNIIVASILIDENLGGTMNVKGNIGVMLPIFTFGQTYLEDRLKGSDAKSKSYLYLINPTCLTTSDEAKQNKKSENSGKEEKCKSDETRECLTEKINKCFNEFSLFKFPIEECSRKGLISFLDLEHIISKKRKEELKVAFDKVITEWIPSIKEKK